MMIPVIFGQHYVNRDSKFALFAAVMAGTAFFRCPCSCMIGFPMVNYQKINREVEKVKLIFVRHGKDDDRYRGGWSDLDLLPEGREQAKALAAYLKENRVEFGITRIVASDLPRALTTAKMIGSELGIAVEEEPQIRETNNGLLAGMENEIALERYPGLFFSSLGMDEPYPGGESPRQFYNRIAMWFRAFSAACAREEGNVLIVTHGGVINVIYHLVKGIEWSNRAKPFRAEHCSIHVLDLQTMELAPHQSLPCVKGGGTA